MQHGVVCVVPPTAHRPQGSDKGQRQRVPSLAWRRAHLLRHKIFDAVERAAKKVPAPCPTASFSGESILRLLWVVRNYHSHA